MSGEAGGTARPVNSLLEEDLNFDHTTAAGNNKPEMLLTTHCVYVSPTLDDGYCFMLYCVQLFHFLIGCLI